MKGKPGRKSLTVIAAVMISFCALSCGAAGAVKMIADIRGSLGTGAVDIGVDVYTVKDGDEVIMEESTTIDYDGCISYIPRIVNRGDSCYIRAGLKAETDTQSLDLLKDIYGIDDSWRYISGYLYYTNPLKNGDNVDICQGFDVPEEWDYMKANDLRIGVTVDAVQSQNIAADFEADDPWGDVEIISSRHWDGNTVNTAASSEEAAADGMMKQSDAVSGKSIEISYVNKAAGITIDHDDAFSDAFFMPGGVYEGRITLCNNNSHESAVMFKALCDESTIDKSITGKRIRDEDPLSEVLQLEIYNGGTFYSGSLSGNDLSEYRTIAELDGGESKDIRVKITLPGEADNAYQKKNIDVTWCFAVAENDANNKVSTAKTGDDTLISVLTAVFILSMAAALILWKRRDKTGNKIERNNEE